MRIFIAACIIIALCAMAVAVANSNEEECRTTIAQKFGKPTKYWRGQCLVEGYGKVVL